MFKVRFQKHYPRLCALAYGYVSDKDDSEDIVQEAFIHIWDKGKDDLPEQEFMAYLATAVKNGCISFCAKGKTTRYPSKNTRWPTTTRLMPLWRETKNTLHQKSCWKKR